LYTTRQDLIHAQRNLRATTTAPANHCADTATRVGIFDEQAWGLSISGVSVFGVFS